MFRTLVSMHLRQTRTIVALGAGMGVVIVVLTSILAQAGFRWPGRAQPMSLDDALTGAIPAILALGWWPLWSMLITVHAFSADRSASAEAFLLARPVPRRTLWLARLCASLAGSAAVVAASACAWRLVVSASSLEPAALEEAGMLVRYTMVCGPALAVAASAAATGLGLNGFAALALSPVLALLFMVPGTMATLHFRAMGELGAPGWAWAGGSATLAIGSLAMFVAGEPGGRRRVRRGLACVTAGLVLSAALFCATHAWTAASLSTDAWFALAAPGTAGDRGVVFLAHRSAALIEPSTQRVRRGFPAFCGAAWNADGSRVAVVTDPGFAGSVGGAPRVQVFDAEGREASAAIPLDGPPSLYSEWELSVFWAGPRLLVHKTSGRTTLVDPASGGRQVVASSGIDQILAVRETAEGRVLVLARSERPDAPPFLLAQLEVEPPRLREIARVRADGRLSWWSQSALSPSGALFADTMSLTRPVLGVLPIPSWADRQAGAARSAGEEDAASVLDLDPVARVAGPMAWAWIADNRLAFLAERADAVCLSLGPGRAGEGRSDATCWQGARSGRLLPSPDGARLLVRLFKTSDESTKRREPFLEGVYDVATGRFAKLPEGVETLNLGAWVSARALLVYDADDAKRTGFIDVDRPLAVRWWEP